MTSAAPWDAATARAIIAGFATVEGGLMPALHAVQGAFGHVPPAAVPLLADVFNLSRADVHGTISFYHDFRTQPAGRHVLKLCRAEACQAMGARGLHEALGHHLGLRWHETTPDGTLTLEPVFCLGLCAVAPAALLDGEPMVRLDLDGLAAKLESLPV